MRPVMHGDVVCAARVLYGAPPDRRDPMMARLLRRAETADAFRRSTGRLHPLFGDGSLMATALACRPGPEPGLGDDDYCVCLATVFKALIAWRRRPTGS